MKSKSQIINNFFYGGRPLVAHSLVFLTLGVISLLQIPINFIMKKYSMDTGILINEFAVIAGIPLIIAASLHLDITKLFPLKKPAFNMIIIASLLTLMIALLIDYTAVATEFFFPLPKEFREIMNRLMEFKGASGFIYKLFILCIVPGICEEIFFRGFCQTSLTAKWGKTVAIIITGFLFAVMHGNPWYLHLYFILGVLLSFVYAFTQTLWVPIVCHIINNAWTFINHSLKIEFPLNIPIYGNIILVITVVLFAMILIKKFKTHQNPSDEA
ncbi:MAG: hypothetical protein COS89_03655 [Deltaproteobacteria bacterium CG07_land_8_20_14_0_80_38_7]|nr:MAG: hypothetical protein COS89_03655 [Deltaproteobacteria bacterium CG07_land_8_20_14_0_80_38_7]